MDRRTFLHEMGGAAVLTIGGIALGGRPALAQVATTPASALSNLGFPEVTFDVSDSRMPTPQESRAGLIQMTVKNSGTKELHFVGVRIPDDVSNDEVMAQMATPDANPAWFDFNTLIALGNPDWPPPGSIARGVVKVTAGRWLLLDPIDGRAPAFWTVTDGGSASPAASAEPHAEVEVGLIEMDFTGLDKPVPAGQRLWKIANNGATAHEFVIVPVPAGTTKETMVANVVAAEQGGDFSWFVPAGGQGITSKGTASWQVFDVKPGAYAAMCLTPGPDGRSHASMGMVRIFTAQ